MRGAITWGFIAIVSLSCASTSSSDDDDGGSSGSGRSFSLVVDRHMIHSSLSVVNPAPGNVFVVLDLTLANSSVNAPLSMAITSFSLRTSASLVLLPSTVSATVEPRCREDLAVAAGGSASCKLAFEISAQQTAAELLYDDHQGHVTTAPVPPVPRPCEILVTWTVRPLCLECIENSCNDPKLVLADHSECTRDVNCYNNCGTTCACIDQCFVTPGCRELAEAIYACLVPTCTASCQ